MRERHCCRQGSRQLSEAVGPDHDGVDARERSLEASANVRVHGWPLGPAGDLHGWSLASGADQAELKREANGLSVGATVLHPPQRCVAAVVVLEVGLVRHGGHIKLCRSSAHLQDLVREPDKDPERAVAPGT